MLKILSKKISEKYVDHVSAAHFSEQTKPLLSNQSRKHDTRNTNQINKVYKNDIKDIIPT